MRIQATFFKDGTAYWNDGHEVAFGHGTGHGNWERTSNNSLVATFILMGFDTTSTSGSGSSLKIRINGKLRAVDLDNITGDVTLTVFAGGADPLSPTDVGGTPLFGKFNITSLRRVKLDPPGFTDIADTENHPENEVAIGAWFGKAVPAPDNTNPPFPNVVMMINLMPDRNVMATDSFEESSPHATAHGGPWIRTANEVRTTFVWTNENTTSDYQGYAKVRITATVDNTKNVMVGTVRPTGVAPGVDVLDLNDAAPFSQFLGQFNIVELTRIKADPSAPTVVGRDYTNRLPTGVWFGEATANNPSTAPFPQIVIMPHFLPSGMVIWNDSWERRKHHGTGFGDWIPTGGDNNSVKAIGVLEEYDVTKANNFGGAYKLRFTGNVNPSNPNKMTGQISLVYFPESAIPLPSPDPTKVFHADSTDAGGTSIGTYTFTNLRRLDYTPGPTSIEEPGEAPPKMFSLGDAYPNPFNPSTTIRFNMPVAAPVSIRIYNINGQFVRELVNQVIPAGYHEFVWNGKNASSEQVASGVYFYQIDIAGFKVSKKVSLLK